MDGTGTRSTSANTIKVGRSILSSQSCNFTYYMYIRAKPHGARPEVGRAAELDGMAHGCV